MSIRRGVHRRGLRYRVDARPLPASRCRVDLLFSRAKVAVFVDGCFWHGCPEHGTRPAHNGEWWAEKLEANIARDRRFDHQLREAGWRVVRIWEHEEVSLAVGRVERAVRAAVTARGDQDRVRQTRGAS